MYGINLRSGGVDVVVCLSISPACLLASACLLVFLTACVYACFEYFFCVLECFLCDTSFFAVGTASITNEYLQHFQD